MERPFDYPGSQSDVFAPEPSHLKRWTNDTPKRIEFGDTGEAFLNITAWSAPEFWEDDWINDIVKGDERFAGERCTHEYDCCGRFYPRRGRVLDISFANDEHGDTVKLVLIGTSYYQNI